MKRFLFVNFILLLALEGYSQEYEIPSSRTEKIIKGDSIIFFEVLYEGINKKLNSSKYYYWYSQGILNKNQGGYSGYLLDGFYKIYSREGKLLEKGNYDCGMKHGEWNKWNSEGKLLYKQNWKKGRKHGEQIFFLKSGVVRVLQYRNGNIRGKEKRYVNGKELKDSNIRKSKKALSSKVESRKRDKASTKGDSKAKKRFFSWGNKTTSENNKDADKEEVEKNEDDELNANRQKTFGKK